MTSRARSARERLGIAGENIVGGHLRQLRLERFPHLSDREFCEMFTVMSGLEMHKSTLSKIERGLRCVYDYEIMKFCNFFEISPNRLFGIEG